MQSILEALAMDDLNTHPSYYKRGTAYARLMDEQAGLYDKMAKRLTKEQAAVTERLLEVESDLSLMDDADYFAYGFQLGALIMIEVFTNMDRLTGPEDVPPIVK